MLRKIAALSYARDNPGPGRLVLPPRIDLVVGQDHSIWLETIWLGDVRPTWEMAGPGALSGSGIAARWSWTPTADDVGAYRLTLRAEGGHVSTILVVHPAVATPASIKILTIGASFETAAVPGNWLEYVDAHAISAGITITWLGTKQAVGATADIYSEATAGSSYLWWVGTATGAPGISPFRSPQTGTPFFVDPLKYSDESLHGAVPDLVIIDQGQNSFGTVNIGTGTEAAEWAAIESQMKTFHDAMVEAWPNATLAPAYALPCNGILHPLGDGHRYRRHIFIEKIKADMEARALAGQRIEIPPMLHCIDPDGGFPHSPENDHFDTDGAVELGRAMFGFLRRFCP